MAITTTIQGKTILGNKRAVWGKSVISGTASTGDVDLTAELKTIDVFIPETCHTAGDGISTNETFPLVGTAVTVITQSNDMTFYWLAIGTGRVI